MSPHTNKVSSENVKRKNTQQENCGHSIRSDSLLEYLAVAKILQIPIPTRHCITLIGKCYLRPLRKSFRYYSSSLA